MAAAVTTMATAVAAMAAAATATAVAATAAAATPTATAAAAPAAIGRTRSRAIAGTAAIVAGAAITGATITRRWRRRPGIETSARHCERSEAISAARQEIASARRARLAMTWRE